MLVHLWNILSPHIVEQSEKDLLVRGHLIYVH